MPPCHKMPCGHTSCATVESDVDGVVVRYCGMCEAEACRLDAENRLRAVRNDARLALDALQDDLLTGEALDTATQAVRRILAALEDEAGR